MASSLALYRKIQGYTDYTLKKLGMSAVLRRRGVGDYPCTVVISEFTPIERMGGLVGPLDTKALISAKGLAITPLMDQDRLVTFVPGTTTEDVTYQIVKRPQPVAPAGVIVMWELTVRND